MRFFRSLTKTVERNAACVVVLLAILLVASASLGAYCAWGWIAALKDDAIMAWATVGIAIATALAAGFAWASARATRKAAQSQVMLRLIERYVSPEMHKALKVLGEFYRVTHKKCAKKAIAHWEAMAQSDKARHDELDSARREVHWFVKNAYQLREEGLVTESQFTALVVSSNGYRLWADFVLPWSKKIHPEDDEGVAKDKHFKWADDLLGEHPPKQLKPPKTTDSLAAGSEPG